MAIRMTSARQVILEELENAQTHLTINQIHDQIKERLPSVNLSTVYRSLDYLTQNKLISISDMGLGTPVYEILNEEAHHHFVCLNCKQVMNLEDNLVAPFFKKIEKQKNAEVLTNHLVVFGLCDFCKEK